MFLMLLVAAAVSAGWELTLSLFAPDDCNAENCSVANWLMWFPILVLPLLMGLILGIRGRARPTTVLVATMVTAGIASVTIIALDALTWDPYDDRLETIIGGGFLLVFALMIGVVFVALGALLGGRLRTAGDTTRS
jgi:hypothetical protein